MDAQVERRHDRVGQRDRRPRLLDWHARVEGEGEGVAPPPLELADGQLRVDGVGAEELGVGVLHLDVPPVIGRQEGEHLLDEYDLRVALVQRGLQARL